MQPWQHRRIRVALLGSCLGCAPRAPAESDTSIEQQGSSGAAPDDDHDAAPDPVDDDDRPDDGDTTRGSTTSTSTAHGDSSTTTAEGTMAVSSGSGEGSTTAMPLPESESGEASESSGEPSAEAPRSDLPAPTIIGVPRPTGPATTLRILDWAGFPAAVSYTFDDSLPSQIDHYPELQATGARMTFYVVCNNNGDDAVWREAALDGHEIGNHTQHHCRGDGSGCTWGTYLGSLQAEIEACSTHIAQVLGVPSVSTLAAPFGNTEWGEAARTSLFINRGAAEGQIAPNDATDPYNLPSHITSQGESAASLIQGIDSARAQTRWQIMLVHSLGDDGGASPIAAQDLLDSIEYALSTGTWVDTVENVGAYWLAQKLLSQASPVASGETWTWSWTLPPHFPSGKFLRVVTDGGTLIQNDLVLPWDEHGYYEVALDAGAVTLTP